MKKWRQTLERAKEITKDSKLSKEEANKLRDTYINIISNPLNEVLDKLKDKEEE